MKWKIGKIAIDNQVGLAPMAGISNPAYMKICEEMGVGWAVTELISAEAMVRNNKKTLEMLDGIDKLNIPVGVQIFGSNPETMAKASRIICNLHKISMIDINMGCPVPKIAVKQQAGSALLKDLNKIKDIVSSVVSSVPCPVTVKIRSGWDENNINACEVAKVCEEAGASAICIHGRTRKQGYSGKVDLDIIRKVKLSVSIPVIGNGDIRTPEDAVNMLKYTGCDAVMIGRGVLGNPFLIRQILEYIKCGTYSSVSPIEKIDTAILHFKYLLETNNEKFSVLEMRKNIGWYFKGLPNSSSIKEEIFKTLSSDKVIELLLKYKEEFLDE